jgi:hypothetical protein
MLRGWIELQLTNGQRFKYVRDTTFSGTGDTVGDPDYRLNHSYYSYGDSAGDTYLYQGDSKEIKSNFESLVGALSSGDSYVLFPETAGDTYIIIRPNEDQPLTAAPQNLGGDTFILSLPVYRRTMLNKNEVVTIAVVEEFEPQDNVYIP